MESMEHCRVAPVCPSRFLLREKAPHDYITGSAWAGGQVPISAPVPELRILSVFEESFELGWLRRV